MKIKSYLPFLPFFIVFLLVGYWTGHQIAVSAQKPSLEKKETKRLPIVDLDSLPPTSTAQAASEPEVLPPIPSLIRPTQAPTRTAPDRSLIATRQRNLLVIGVNELGSSNPGLESIWLVIYMPGQPRFMLLPVYPSQSTSPSSPDNSSQLLAQVFQLDDTKTPGSDFLNALEEKGLWWTGYIILDKVALLDVVEFLGGAGEYSSLDGASTIASLPNAMADPQQALASQAKLFQELCSNVSRMSVDDHWRLPHLFSLIPDHAISSLDLVQVSAEWQDLLNHFSEVACEFPSLSQTNLHP